MDDGGTLDIVCVRNDHPLPIVDVFHIALCLSIASLQVVSAASNTFLCIVN